LKQKIAELVAVLRDGFDHRVVGHNGARERDEVTELWLLLRRPRELVPEQLLAADLPALPPRVQRSDLRLRQDSVALGAATVVAHVGLRDDLMRGARRLRHDDEDVSVRRVVLERQRLDADERRLRDAGLDDLRDALGDAGELERSERGEPLVLVLAEPVDDRTAVDRHRIDVNGDVVVLLCRRQALLRVESVRLFQIGARSCVLDLGS
jgi:hypothetical protein